MTLERPARGSAAKPATGLELADDLRTKVAWLYFMEGMTQDRISRSLGISRSRVLRLIASSRQSGVVQIRVTTRLSHCVRLERALEAGYGLERAIVIPRPQESAAMPELIGAVLGAYVGDSLGAGMTIGLGWGRTLNASLPAIRQQERSGLCVVSLLGGLTRVSGVNPSEFAWRLADRLAAECYLMAAPVYAPDARTRQALMAHPGIQEVFRKAERLDLALLSVGELSPVSTVSEYGLVGREDLASLEKAGAVGDVLCRFIDAGGHIVDHPVNERVIAVDPRGLKSARRLVLASGGWQKYAAIRAAMKLLAPHVLVTDEGVAERLAAEKPGD